jgi:hypothetical protein
MSSLGIEIPSITEYDARQAQRDAQMERIRQSLDWGAIRMEVLERLALDMLTHEGPVGAVIDMLESAPVSSVWDLESWLKWCAPRDSAKIGKALMAIIGQCCLEAVQAADDATF